MQDLAHTHLALPTEGSCALAAAGGCDPYETLILHLLPGETWTGPADGVDVQLLVIEGEVQWGAKTLGIGSFVRLGWSSNIDLQTGAGCRLLIKTGNAPSDVHVAVDPSTADWSPGQGNLRVLPLESRGQESTALVHWPAGERFLPHRHFGGEEIFVLSGTFRDEHGSYPAGTWLQSPHGSVHHPFVVEETRIWVKTGHLTPRKGG